MLSDYLYNFREIHFFFNLFNYISFRAGLSLVSSFVLILIFMPYWIRAQKKLCIIGSIKELGNHTEKYHRALLEDIKDLKVKKIILIGEEFFKLRSSYKTFNFYKSHKSYINLMKKDLEYGKNIFVMGSRLNNLDKVIQNIC